MAFENFEIYTYTTEELNYEEILSFIESVPPFISILPKDTLETIIQIENDIIFRDSIDYDNFNYNSLKENMKRVLETDEVKLDIEDFNCVLKYHITKNSSLNTFSIYDFESLMKYLINQDNPKTLANILNLFKKYSVNEKKVYFNNHEGFELETNLFTSQGLNIAKEVSNDQRNKKYDAWNFFSNNQNLTEYDLLPEDFINTEIIDANEINSLSEDVKSFQLLLIKIGNFLMLSFLVDFVRLDDNTLTLRINERYKRFKEHIIFHETEIENTDVLKNIYDWVFFSTKNEIEDRLEITKNVLSRKLTLENNKLILKKDAYFSIIDAHKIYLKENVTQYFEVKKEVANLITDITSKNSDMIKNISSAFKISSGTLVTYFISLFIFNSLSSGKMEVFNKSNYAISVTLLILSILSMILTYKQTTIDKNLVEKHFNSIKENYREDFDSDHLEKLFSNQILTDAKKSLESSKKLFRTCWIIELIVLFLMITGLVFHSEFADLFVKAINMIKLYFS